MSYLYYLNKFKSLHNYTESEAIYNFTLKLCSLLPSQKHLLILEEFYDNYEDLYEFSKSVFETLISKEIDLKSVFS